MRICFFADARAEHTRRWAKYFSTKGHDVYLITMNPDILEHYESVKVFVVNKPVNSSSLFAQAWNLPCVLGRIKNILKDIKPNVVHAHSAGAYAWLTFLTGYRPYVITPWGSDILIDAKGSHWNRFLTVKALRDADLITCDGYNIKEEMVKIGVPENKIEFVFFGVDIRRFRPIQDKKDSNSLVIISTRTLNPVHDVRSFIKAIPKIKKEFPQSKFIIVGEGTDRNMLEEFAKSLKISADTVFVGRVEEDEMANLLNNADVYVSTSLSDSGIAASTAEAMACGLPVVITDNGDNRRWVSEGNGGFIIPVQDSVMLAERVIALLKDINMRQSFGCKNRKIIEERNNYLIEMERMELLYKSL